MVWFWYFVIYSFFGFLLEAAFARASGGRPDRKCLLLLPLCPVYGLGAGAILLLAPLAGNHPARLFLLGGAAATAVEYAVGWWYETFLGVSFWDYTGLPGSLQGRVCLPFSLAWAALSLPLVHFVHPAVRAWVSAVPVPVTLSMAALVLSDLAVSAVLLKVTGDRASLQWYRK
ncbi:MAG: putative ABC transporter permease [Lawsonibacter sp.]|nr:putative ABC transporter permease [Lawsonibacter sp.]